MRVVLLFPQTQGQRRLQGPMKRRKTEQRCLWAVGHPEVEREGEALPKLFQNLETLSKHRRGEGDDAGDGRRTVQSQGESQKIWASQTGEGWGSVNRQDQKPATLPDYETTVMNSMSSTTAAAPSRRPNTPQRPNPFRVPAVFGDNGPFEGQPSQRISLFGDRFSRGRRGPRQLHVGDSRRCTHDLGCAHSQCPNAPARARQTPPVTQESNPCRYRS